MPLLPLPFWDSLNHSLVQRLLNLMFKMELISLWIISASRRTHIGEETFQFTIPSKTTSNFTFAAVSKLLSQMPTKKGHTILCLIPGALIDRLLALTTDRFSW